MISENSKCIFLHVLKEINEIRANNCTIQEVAKDLGISERKMKYFIKGKCFDFWLLEAYAAYFGKPIGFYFKS